MSYGRIRCQLELERRGNGGNMATGKIGVSTNVDVDLYEDFEAFCALVSRTRSQVMRGLLLALLVDGKQVIFDDWRDRAAGRTPRARKATVPRITARESILRAMRRYRTLTVRELKRVSGARTIIVAEWEKAFQALCRGGELTITDQKAMSGRMRKMVTLVGE
jgi:hypothetical protein